MAKETDLEKNNQEDSRSGKSVSESCCCYAVDPCGCYVDPCGCYVSRCCC